MRKIGPTKNYVDVLFIEVHIDSEEDRLRMNMVDDGNLVTCPNCDSCIDLITLSHAQSLENNENEEGNGYIALKPEAVDITSETIPTELFYAGYWYDKSENQIYGVGIQPEMAHD